MRVRRRMDFDDDLDSPTKSSRKDKLFTVKLLINLVIYMISFYRKLWYCWRDLADRGWHGHPPGGRKLPNSYTPSKPHRICASPKNPPRNLFLNTSPTKEATSSLTLRSNTPKKTPLRENLENQQVLHTDKSTSLNSPVKMKLQQPNGKYHF
jgi:hypothetical protein